MNDITKLKDDKPLENSECITSDIEILHKAMEEVTGFTKEKGVGIVAGKKYSQVQDRIIYFRKHFGLSYGIKTRILTEFSVPGEIITIQAEIINMNGTVVGSGIASEHIGVEQGGLQGRDYKKINVASGVENCDTSAIGRALASIGLHGGEYASANEMIKAVTGNKDKELFKKDYPLGIESVNETLKAMSDSALADFLKDKKRISFIKEHISHEQDVALSEYVKGRLAQNKEGKAK